MNNPRIIADQNMPHVEAYFGHLGEVKLMAGREIDSQAIQGAEILLVPRLECRGRWAICVIGF